MLGSRRRGVLSALAGLLLLGTAVVTASTQLRGQQQEQLQLDDDEFGASVLDYYSGHGQAPSAPLGRGLVVGEDDAWAPVVSK